MKPEFEMDLRFQQEHDPEPADFNLEQQLTLEVLQQEVKIGQCTADEADKRMRRVFGAFFYQMVRTDGTSK